MNSKHLLLDRVIPGAAGAAAALFLSRFHPSPESLLGYGTVILIALIGALEYNRPPMQLS
jgi:hypothetical protein